MIKPDLREDIKSDFPEALLFDNPSFDGSIIGATDNGQIVYDYSKMIDELMVDENMNLEDAVDFISYNTIRAVDYISSEFKPIVIFPYVFEEEAS